MAINIKSGDPVKGAPTSFTLNITGLLGHASVLADAYFAVQTNWDKVIYNYTSTEGGQKEYMTFSGVDTGITADEDFEVSATARNIFEITSIVIVDKDGGTLTIPNSALVASEFDVDMTEPLEKFTGGSVAGIYFIYQPTSTNFRVMGQQFKHDGTGTYTVDKIKLRLGVTGSPTRAMTFYIAPDNDRANPILTKAGVSLTGAVDSAYFTIDFTPTQLTDGIKYMFYIIVDETGGTWDGSNEIGPQGWYIGGTSYRNTSYGMIDGQGQYADGLTDLVGMSAVTTYDWDFQLFGDED